MVKEKTLNQLKNHNKLLLESTNISPILNWVKVTAAKSTKEHRLTSLIKGMP